MFKIESYFGPLLMSYLNKYVKLEEESFKLSLWGGDVTFHNLELQYDILEDLMPLPIGLKSGQVHELNVHVPWTKLGSESVVITLNTVECIIALKSDFIHKSKRADLKKESFNTGQKQRIEKNIPPGYLKSYLVNIINNIHVKVNNLIIKFVEDDIVLSMNAKSLEYLPVTQNWSRGFVDFSTGNLLVHKIVLVSDLTVCLDQMDANGHIELYQEPILYRCSVECRFILQYQSFVANKPIFLKFNIKFGNLELNVTIGQMPMIRRLLELFYTLYYNTINWDAVVGCGFTNQITKTPEKMIDLDKDMPIEVQTLNEEVVDASWGSWAWSYVPSVFSYEENFSEEDNLEGEINQDINNKRKLIFGIYFDSMQVNLKKSQSIKSHYGNQRSGRSQKTVLFMTIKGNNIGLNLTSNGVGFFNVQLGCTDIDLNNGTDVCPCGQIYKVEENNKTNEESVVPNCLFHMGSPGRDVDTINNFFLTGSLFSVGIDDKDDITKTLNKLDNISSQETYGALFSQVQCLEKFGALWFDYVYCMQIVNNDMIESQIDMSNLCNTDGIRESSVINLYIGSSIFNVNSYFVHNLIEVTRALDISKYPSYFKTFNNDDRRSKAFYPTEDQVARIHEFIPIRHYNISLTNSTININTFLESHNLTKFGPMIELKTKVIKFSKSSPMYPIHLIDCVSVLSTNFLKESKELLNKCYLSKSIEVTGLSMSLLVPEIFIDNIESTNFAKSEIISPCNISWSQKTLLYSETWKSSQFISDEKTIDISNITLKMIPSHIKTAFVVISSNYSWIANYFQFVELPSNVSSLNRQLDDITLKLIDPQGSLVETCFRSHYMDKTYELHVCLPSSTIKCWKTHSSYFIDAKVCHDSLFAYLKEPLSTKIIPVLDNKLDDNLSQNSSFKPPFCLLYCQIPIQTRPVNCAFSFHCQVGSLNCIFSSQLINWCVFPTLDFDLDESSRRQSITTSTKSRESTVFMAQKLVSDTRSTADGNSRPQSPTILFNKYPVPGHPRSISNTEKSLKESDGVRLLSNKSGWWNMFKDGCSKYFFFLQSLDVCIKMRKSKFHIITVTDSRVFLSEVQSCSQWVDKFTGNDQCSVFVITMTRLALINSQRKEYLDDSFEKGSKFQQGKSPVFIESLPWELIFHDIQVDCVHSLFLSPRQCTITYDSILKPVSINCTLSATPKCSSPERLDTLYSISWGIHVDITEVQPTLKQIYLIKLLDFFVNICLKVSCTEFRQKHYQLLTGHYGIVRNNNKIVTKYEQAPLIRSKHSISTKSTIKSTSRSSVTEHKVTSSNYRLVSSKLETSSFPVYDVGFKLSFWVQCTLSQFQFIVILNDNEDGQLRDRHTCLVMQIDDVTGSVDIQEKFVEIKSKFGSIFCQLGMMKDGEIISETPILKSGSKFLTNTSYNSKLKDEHIIDDILLDNGNRHCLSAALIRTTVNNLSLRPLSSYHHIQDTDSFKSYPTEFTGNFSTVLDSTSSSSQNFVTQISGIVEPFELIISSHVVEQCHKLTDTLIAIYLRFFHSNISEYCLSKKISVSSIKSEPYFISDDMPKFHLLVKSSKIIMPCNPNKSEACSQRKDNDNTCIILSWNKISLQPFSDNPISRPNVKTENRDDDDSINTKCDSTLNSMESEQKSTNSLDDNRQFQLNIINCSIYSSVYNGYSQDLLHNSMSCDITLSKSTHYSDLFGASILHGQNPAFEWNNYSKMSSSFNLKKSTDCPMKPILKPIDIQINFAGALYEISDNNSNQRQLLGGYGLEINILTSVEFLLDMSEIESLNVVLGNLKKLFIFESAQLPIRQFDQERNSAPICCFADWITENKLDHIIPCVPTNILITTRKIQILLFLQNNLNVSSDVYGLCLAISQPHLLLYFKDHHHNKLEVSLFDISVMVTPHVWSETINFFDRHNDHNNWTYNQSFILAEMRTVLKTKPGSPDMKTGVPKSFCTVSLTDCYQAKESTLRIDFSRQILVDLDICDLEQIVLLCNCLFSLRRTDLTQDVGEIDTFSPANFPVSVLTPRYVSIAVEIVSVKFGDSRQLDSLFELVFGKCDVRLKTVKNYLLDNLQSSMELKCDSIIFETTSKEYQKVLLLRPLNLSGTGEFRQYRVNAVDQFWRSQELFCSVTLGPVHLSLNDQLLITARALIKNLHHSMEPLLDRCSSINVDVDNSKYDNRIELFYDDLRSERFQILDKMSPDVSVGDQLQTIADDGTVMFSDDGGDDLAAMYWTYPESRVITRIEVKPVPFVFIEYKLTKEDNYENLQIPCQLEYWSSSNNCYQEYKKFHLSENQVEIVDDFPTLDKESVLEQRLVVSKSWRVVFDCYARYKIVDCDNTISYSERAMLVYLSPLVLAASMKVDSCYAPSAVRNSHFSISSQLIQIEYSAIEKNHSEDLCDSFKRVGPYYEDCSIADQNLLFTISCNNCFVRYFLTGDVHSHIASSALYISEPFVALKSAMFIVDDINFTMEVDQPKISNVIVDIGVIRTSIEEFTFRQLLFIADHFKELVNILLYFETNQLAVNSQKLLFCNFLDRRIRLRQHQDSFYYFPESSKRGGVAPGEEVTLKFLPNNYSKYHNTKSGMMVHEPIKLTLGLCSELKGTVRWTESIELPDINYNRFAGSTSNLKMWNIDSTASTDAPICSNSSNLSNSYNAKSLLLLHNQSITGFNKLVLMGNTMFNNLTTEHVHVSFSLPSEISSGFSFNASPSASKNLVTSIHINWKFASLASPKNIFELSFRIVSMIPSNVEYRSYSYKMVIPKFDNSTTKYQYRHTIIKLKEHRPENQIVTPKDHWKQILCTMEWFQLTKNDDIFLLMTLSPIVICRNMMLHDVKMHLTWVSEIGDSCEYIKESFIVPSNGGLLNIVDFFKNKAIEVNASFLNDPKLLFDKPLLLTEFSLIESLDQNFRQSYWSQNQDLDHDLIRQNLSNRLFKIINKDNQEPINQTSENPFSVLVTITPWILVTNNTNMDLFLGFDRNIYLLEAANDFVPPQYDKPVKIGIAHDNEIYWSKTFPIGDCILSQNDQEMSSDLLWNIVDTEQGTESYLQISITLVKENILVPVTLKHVFARQSPNTQGSKRLPRSTTRYNHLLIESSVYVSNHTTKYDLDILPISTSRSVLDDSNYSVTVTSLAPTGYYVPLSKFVHLQDNNSISDDNRWSFSLTKQGHQTEIASINHLASILDFQKIANFRDATNITYSNFTYVEHQNKECEEIEYIAFTVNSTLDYRSHKIFTDIFECKCVPIKINNHSPNQIFINPFEDNGQKNNQTISVVTSNQSVPLWPNNCLLDINKDGCANLKNLSFRMRIGVKQESDIDWTDYFPITAIEDPTPIDVITIVNRQHIFVYTRSSTSMAIIDIHIYDTPTTFNEATVTLPKIFTTSISVTNCILSVLENGDNLECPSETVRLSMDNSSLIYSYNPITECIGYEMSIGDLQLDNKRYDTGLYDFPVVIYSKNSETHSTFLTCFINTDKCDRLSLDLKFEQKIEVFVENLLLYDMLRIFTKLSQCIVKIPDLNMTPVYSSAPLNLGTINISSIPLCITVHAFLKLYVSCEATSLSLPKFSCHQSMIRFKVIQRKFYEHYVTAALVRCGWVMGSFELLGNPTGIVHHLTVGLSNLMCSKNIDHGLLTDFLLRILSFCRYTTGGLVSSFTGIASSVSRNLDYISLDDSHITRQDSFRRQYQPSGVMRGFVQGLSGFAISLLGAIAGLADHPLHDSQVALNNNSSVTIALLKGLGKGLVGVVTKPLGGTAELFAQTGRGILRTTGISILRCHAQFNESSQYPRTEILIDEHQVLRHLCNWSESITNESLCMLWSSIGVNNRGQLVYLLLTSDSLIEWSIDYPIRNKHNVYRLSQYNIILCPLSSSTSSMSGHSVIRLIHVHNTDNQSSINADFRINAFLSEQVCDPTPIVNVSSSSSLDSTSTDYVVTFPDQYSVHSTTDDSVTHFIVNHCPDGIFNSLTFLQLSRDSKDTITTRNNIL